MAQGAIKKKSSSGSVGSGGRKRSQKAAVAPKKGKRSIAPRKTALVKARGITKKYSSNLTNETERNLAQKAGHLELLQGGKKKGGGGGVEKGGPKKGGK